MRVIADLQPTTYREVSEHIGRSHSTTYGAIGPLIAFGYVANEPNKCRTMRLTEKGRALLCELV